MANRKFKAKSGSATLHNTYIHNTYGLYIQLRYLKTHILAIADLFMNFGVKYSGFENLHWSHFMHWNEVLSPSVICTANSEIWYVWIVWLKLKNVLYCRSKTNASIVYIILYPIHRKFFSNFRKNFFKKSGEKYKFDF